MTSETPEQAYARGIADALALVDDVRALVPSLMPANGQRLTLTELAQAIATYGADRLDVLRPFSTAEAISQDSLSHRRPLAERLAGLVREIRDRPQCRGKPDGVPPRPALLALLDGDAIALAALLAGRRDHPAVGPYLVRAGLPIAA